MVRRNGSENDTVRATDNSSVESIASVSSANTANAHTMGSIPQKQAIVAGGGKVLYGSVFNDVYAVSAADPTAPVAQFLRIDMKEKAGKATRTYKILVVTDAEGLPQWDKPLLYIGGSAKFSSLFKRQAASGKVKNLSVFRVPANLLDTVKRMAQTFFTVAILGVDTTIELGGQNAVLDMQSDLLAELTFSTTDTDLAAID